MSTPIETSSRVTVWPPALNQAPEEIIIERLTIRRADTLMVRNPSVRRGTIIYIAFQAIWFFVGWMDSFHIWFNHYHLIAPHGHTWNDPFFRHQIALSALIYLAMFTFSSVLSWSLYVIRQAKGVIIYQSSRTAEIGRRSGRVAEINVRRDASLGIVMYFTNVSMDAHDTPYLARIFPSYRFWKWEDANRFAELLAEFMNVPLTRSA